MNTDLEQAHHVYEMAPPVEKAPFWNLETLWAAKMLHAALFGLGGLVLAGNTSPTTPWRRLACSFEEWVTFR